MRLYLFNFIVLLDLTTSNKLYIPSKHRMMSKPFDMIAFNGTWFEAGAYNTLLIPPYLEHWPTTLAYCPTWHFSAKPGEFSSRMDVTYYTTSVKKTRPLIFTGSLIKLPTSVKLQDEFIMDLYPSENEFKLSSGEVHVDFSVIDTDYYTYAFIYLVEHHLLLEKRESVLALSRYKKYAKNFNRLWMKDAMEMDMDYSYDLDKCTEALPEDIPIPTQFHIK